MPWVVRILLPWRHVHAAGAHYQRLCRLFRRTDRVLYTILRTASAIAAVWSEFWCVGTHFYHSLRLCLTYCSVLCVLPGGTALDGTVSTTAQWRVLFPSQLEAYDLLSKRPAATEAAEWRLPSRSREKLWLWLPLPALVSLSHEARWRLSAAQWRAGSYDSSSAKDWHSRLDFSGLLRVWAGAQVSSWWLLSCDSWCLFVVAGRQHSRIPFIICNAISEWKASTEVRRTRSLAERDKGVLCTNAVFWYSGQSRSWLQGFRATSNIALRTI